MGLVKFQSVGMLKTATLRAPISCTDTHTANDIAHHFHRIIHNNIQRQSFLNLNDF